MAIQYTKYNTQLQQNYQIVHKIHELIEQGESPSEIAIISRRHKSLESLVPLLNNLDIPYYYEKSNNVLENYYISQLLTQARLICHLSDTDKEQGEYLLPEILSYPHWGLSDMCLWEIARRARKDRIGWLECMLLEDTVCSNHSDDALIKQIARFFLSIAKQAHHETAEVIIDRLVGVGDTDVPESADDDGEYNSKIESNPDFISPFKSYYFDSKLYQSLDSENAHHGSHSYVELLCGLRVLIQAIRSHRGQEVFKLMDLIEFVDLLSANKMSLADKQIFFSKSESVNVLSAHKAKGLEFKHVFVINTVKSEWEAKGYSNKISFPDNIPLIPGKDTTDDYIRLFFVAITRAKQFLYVTSYVQDEGGKEVEDVSFAQIEWDIVADGDDVIEDILSQYVHKSNDIKEMINSHKKLLAELVEDYSLSVTHLLNYLDTTKGGPRNFLETNLLRFPQAKSVSASYGTAVHNALHGFWIEFVRSGRLPSREFLLDQFAMFLRSEGLNDQEYKEQLKIGNDNLSIFYQNRYQSFDPKSITERDFKYYNVMVGDARITGKIDRMDLNGEDRDIQVVDYKTGKPLIDWKQSDAHKIIKSWRYENQLIFYKLLVEQSSEFGGKYEVNHGCLEFIHHYKNDTIILSKNLTRQEAHTMAEIIKIVYKKIQNLDFPDTSHYPPTYKGIQQFIDDLIEGKI